MVMKKSGAASTVAKPAAAPGDKPASIPAADTFSPSGAPNQSVSDVDPAHPAVDSNPRENTTVDQNRIDFNDPTLTGQEAVEANLAAQASK
jgi:hypothetical protein